MRRGLESALISTGHSDSTSLMLGLETHDPLRLLAAKRVHPVSLSRVVVCHTKHGTASHTTRNEQSAGSRA